MQAHNTTTPTAIGPQAKRQLAHLLRDRLHPDQSADYARRVAREAARRQLQLARLPVQVGAELDDLIGVIRARMAVATEALHIRERLEAHLTDRYVSEVDRRGGETHIETEKGRVPLSLIGRHAQSRLVLLGADGWRYYSRAAGSHSASLRYLCGEDDSGPFAVRVAGSVQSVSGALEWLEPTAVRRARLAGRRVLRQGDVYVVESTRDHFDDLPDAHRWNSRTRYLTHHPDDGRKHRPIKVSFLARAYPQRTYAMGRGGRWGDAD